MPRGATPGGVLPVSLRRIPVRAAVPSVRRMIGATALTKPYGGRAAVDDLTFTVRPGRVTGFLGPGRVSVAGRPYAAPRAPLRTVGSLLDATGVHGGRSARDHLAGLAARGRDA
ncbi:hypothetical protein GCM10009801_20820 [Streptomyces albiaxialis]|uniref:ABC transporter ATP-binding protein n=1 Tax=Streptomyces albiaxialis TaxID=329523 RepID=A0ABN2VS30_9ACTN